jgi:hypothetical protein
LVHFSRFGFDREKSGNPAAIDWSKANVFFKILLCLKKKIAAQYRTRRFFSQIKIKLRMEN